jgi:hypothetical protein
MIQEVSFPSTADIWASLAAPMKLGTHWSNCDAGFGYLEVKCLGCSTHRTVRARSCGDRRRRRSMNSNATCAADSAPKSGAMPTSATTSSHYGQRRFPRPIRPRRGGRKSDEWFLVSRSVSLLRSRLGLILGKFLVFPLPAAATPPYLSKNELS